MKKQGEEDGPPKELRRASLEGSSLAFQPIPEEKRAPKLAFRSVNPLGSFRAPVLEEPDEQETPQPPAQAQNPQRRVNLGHLSMQINKKNGISPSMEDDAGNDDAGHEFNAATWAATPAVVKMNEELQMLSLLADAVEPKMPNNAKHMRDSLEQLQNGVGILGAQQYELRKVAERDALTVNRHIAWANIRNNRFAALHRASVRIPPESVASQKPRKTKYMSTVNAVTLILLSLTVLVVLTRIKDRLPHHEPLQGVFSVSSTHPIILPLKSNPTEVVETSLRAPPWEAVEKDSDIVQHSSHLKQPKMFLSLMRYNGTEAIHERHSKKLLSAEALSGQIDFIFQKEEWEVLTPLSECKVEKKSRICHERFEKVDRFKTDNGFLAVVVELNPSGLRLPAEIHIHQFGWLGHAKIWIALIVLLVVLGLIALEVIHRTLVAMAGSFIMLALLLCLDMTPDLETVLEWVDEGALALLFGMMILVGKLSSTGFFEVATVKVISLCRGNMWTLVVIMSALTAVLSAFLDNVTTVLLIAPVTIQMASALHISPIPLLICEVLFSNIGGTATMIGDPPNIIIGNSLDDYLGFVDFIVALAPPVLIMSPPCIFLLRLLFKKELTGRLEKYDEVLQLGKSFRIKNKQLLVQTGIVLGAVILAFLLHPLHHVNVAWVSILGAVTLMLVSSPRHIHKDLEVVEWDTLLFFASLFVMVEAMGEVGLIRKIGEILISIIEAAPEGSRSKIAPVLILWVSALVSAFLDNIPYTATMVPVVKQLSEAGLGLSLEPLAWALALGACLGGNGSLVGASANIVVAGIAEREGYHISFMSFLSKSFPVMILSVTISMAYLLLFQG